MPFGLDPTTEMNSRCLGDYEMLAGNLASIGVGGIVTCVTSFIVRSFLRVSFT